jgi:hypothetical protein
LNFEYPVGLLFILKFYFFDIFLAYIRTIEGQAGLNELFDMGVSFKVESFSKNSKNSFFGIKK